MISTFFPNCNLDSRVFIFQSINRITTKEINLISNVLNNDFLPNWTSHQTPVNGEFVILYNHFIVVSTQLSAISGCAIDSLFNTIKDIGLKLNVNLLDRLHIPYFQLPKSETGNSANLKIPINMSFLLHQDFIEKADCDLLVIENFFVFDNSITTLHDAWLIPFKDWKEKYIK